MSMLLSDEEVVDIQTTLRQVRAELDSVTYAVHENVARVQQLWGYLELKLREMDRAQRPLPSRAPVTPTGPKKPWEDGASAGTGTGGKATAQTKKTSDRK